MSFSLLSNDRSSYPKSIAIIAIAELIAGGIAVAAPQPYLLLMAIAGMVGMIVTATYHGLFPALLAGAINAATLLAILVVIPTEMPLLFPAAVLFIAALVIAVFTASRIASQAQPQVDSKEQQPLQNTQQLRQELDQLRATLFSSMAHDMKSPLATVIGSLSAIEHLGASLDAGTQKELIATAHSEAERLNNFITNILELSRLESASVILKPEWVSPAELVNGLMKRPQFSKLQERIKILPSLSPYIANVDITMMERLLSNLLDNSLRYSPANSTVFFSYEKKEHGAVMSVIDHGTGISAEQQAEIFKKYSHGSKGRSGKGLGLAIAKAIIEAHHGTISLGDTPNPDNMEFPGTAFIISIPESIVKKAEEPVAEEEYVPHPATAAV